jgi:hypothetical protein
MESMDNLYERIEALEQQMKVMGAHTRTVERRLRWWRGIACGVMLLGLVSLPLQSGTAADTQPVGMGERMAAVEKKLSAMAFDDAANEVVITGANLRIVNGLGATTTTNGLGNVIVGYNEERGDGTDNRTGSHNVVVGRRHNFSSFGGLVVGDFNEISGQFASVSGGANNVASGNSSSVSGGTSNTASAVFASSVSGGGNNTASGNAASVSGGAFNTASGIESSVSGGVTNTANGNLSSISGGEMNTITAPAFGSWIGGGQGNTANGLEASVSGGQNNTAFDGFSSVSGGFGNTASGEFASVSGGQNRTAPAQFNWAAGALFSDH